MYHKGSWQIEGKSFIKPQFVIKAMSFRQQVLSLPLSNEEETGCPEEVDQNPVLHVIINKLAGRPVMGGRDGQHC